jgi:pyruvate dehydrogenase E1 component
MKRRREALGGFYPKRRPQSAPLTAPPLDLFQAQLDGSGDREISTTMAFVRMLSSITKDKRIGKRVVPIVPDEARTFGMEGMFRQLGIYTSEGQKYVPNDRDQVMYYREDQAGQILEEGINEAGAMAAWIACATSYSVHDYPLIPFYIFYSMFGFQRVGDLAWAAGDMRSRGFLIGGTAGRTTLNGEGLQHQDGHSHILASTIPNCIAYDPAFACELAVIVQHGIKRMYEDNESVYYYITVTNENYKQLPLVEGSEDAILRGMYLREEVDANSKLRVQLLGSGAIFNEVSAAAQILKEEFNVSSNIWSVTSFNELARDGQLTARWNMLNPDATSKSPYIAECLNDEDPVIASTDYMRLYGEQVRAYVNAPYTVLGTDGFGRSDTREKLRHFFEVDRYYIVVAALNSLASQGKVDMQLSLDAMRKFNIDRSCIAPMLR